MIDSGRRGTALPAPSTSPRRVTSTVLVELLDLSPDALLVVNQAEIIIMANEQVSVLFGYSREELLGKPHEMLLPESLRVVHRAHRQHFFTRPHTRSMGVGLHLLGQRKNGTQFPVDISLRPVLLQDELLVIAAIRDMSEQAALAEAEARAAELEAIFEAMIEAVIVCDARGEIRYTNAAYRSTLGLEEDADPSLLQLDTRYEWLALRDLEGRLLPKEHMPVLRVLRGERLSGTHTIDLLCHTRKGEDHILNFSGAPIRDAAGQIVGGVVVSRDVTGQYRLKQQLQYSERKLRSLVESNIFGVWVLDDAGHIHEINDRLVQMLGYSKEELLSGTIRWRQLTPPEYQVAQEQTEKTILSTGAFLPYEKEYLRKDGSRVPVLIAGAMIDQERAIGIEVVLDMSEKIAAERRKQEFLSMVSHELRTPLTSIMGFLDLALLCSDLLPRPLSPEEEQLMSKMETGLKRAMAQVEIETRLVEELLEVSRLERYTFELSVQRENLVTIVQETVANQQQAARTRQIELVLPSDEIVPVLADAGRIGQVLTNYLTNALKYGPVDQVVAVRLKVEACSARVSVRDLGPGLTPEQQQQVWERFYQVAAPGRQGPDRGLGLGLAITRAIIEQHHGQVGVQSVPGQGSTFWFSLPLADGRIQA
jgi:PAS domain S-box-containing protein